MNISTNKFEHPAEVETSVPNGSGSLEPRFQPGQDYQPSQMAEVETSVPCGASVLSGYSKLNGGNRQ
jgi:hypothetical protein